MPDDPCATAATEPAGRTPPAPGAAGTRHHAHTTGTLMPDPTACPACAGRGWTLTDARIVPCDCGVYDPPKWVTRGDAPCLIPHWRDPDRPRRASVGYACAGHRDRIEQLLAELPALHDDLGLVLTTSEDPNHDRVQSSREPGLNLNRKAVDARGAIRAELVGLVREILEDQPALPCPADTVPALATWLVGQVDWLCAQLNVDADYARLDQLTRDCRKYAYPNGSRRFPIPDVTCQAPLSCDVITRRIARCPGRLIVALIGDDDREALSEITCEACGMQIASAGWLTWATARSVA